MSENEKSLEDKINYIYYTLQKQESRYKRKLVFKWLFRLFIVVYLIYAFLYVIPPLINNAKKIIIPQLEKIQWLNLDLQKIGGIDLNNLDLETIKIDDKAVKNLESQSGSIQKILEQLKWITQ